MRLKPFALALFLASLVPAASAHAAPLAGVMPNLRVLDVTARPGLVPNPEAYTVDVMNAGLAPASRIGLQLVVDGATPDTATIDSLQPGELRAIHFTGPGCRHRVRA